MWWKSASAPAESLRRLALAWAVLLAAGCQPEPGLQQRIIPVFGTIVQVEIAGVDETAGAAALDALESLYRRLDSDWRSFGPGELGRVNDLLAAGQPAILTPELQRMVRRSLQIRELSGGLFDPRIGSLVELWGFQDMASRTPDHVPSDEQISRSRASSLHAAVLHLSGGRISADAPVRLELAGIAKGSALAAGAAELRAHGVSDALIVAGGDVLALGRRGERPWRVGVRDPLGTGTLGSLDLEDGEGALSSGNYERRFRAGGRTWHHIIDPRTGQPSRGTAGATVVDRDVELANAAATALLIGGATRFGDLAASLGVDCALLVTEAGEIFMTPAMRSRLQRP